MADSTTKNPRHKSKLGDLLPKPYDNFPLFPHATGKWAKKIRKQLRYFGQWAKRVDGELVRVKGDGWKEALALYDEQKDDLEAGRLPRQRNSVAPTIMDLCNRFLTAKTRQVDAGELQSCTFDDYKRTTDRIVASFGKNRLLDDLASDDFEKLRSRMAKTWGPHRIGKFVQCVKTVFKYAYEAELIDRPVRFGPAFKKPSADVLRKHKAARPKRLFTAAEIQLMLNGKTIREKSGESKHADGASMQLRAMILLGINCGFGNTDVAKLPLHAVDLNRGWIDFPRPKNGIARRAKLWPETVAALADVIANRTAPVVETNAVFITTHGNEWIHGTTQAVGPEFAKLLSRFEIDGRAGRSFYALRHTYQTAADSTKDFPAIRLTMGHAEDSIVANYREEIDDDRLVAVSNHVRSRLLGTLKKRPPK